MYDTWILIDIDNFSKMTPLCRHLSPTSIAQQQTGSRLPTGAFTPPTRRNSTSLLANLFRLVETVAKLRIPYTPPTRLSSTVELRQRRRCVLNFIQRDWIRSHRYVFLLFTCAVIVLDSSCRRLSAKRAFYSKQAENCLHFYTAALLQSRVWKLTAYSVALGSVCRVQSKCNSTSNMWLDITGWTVVQALC